MKVILSRKGFDTSIGKIPNVILEDNSLLIFPIPAPDEKYLYEKLHYKNMEESLYQILKNLGYDFSQGITCHPDPDLTNWCNVENGWHAAFGQCGSSASYLRESVKIEEGDLFLFFGQFCKCDVKKGKYDWNNYGYGNRIHLIWGYLQVGKIVNTEEEMCTDFSAHPHSQKKYWENKASVKNNVLYVARDKLSFNEDLPGAGLFPFSNKRILTKRGFSMANWDKNLFGEPKILENHIPGKSGKKRKNASSNKDECIYYQGQWQELGLEISEDSANWAKGLFFDIEDIKRVNKK